MVVECRQVRGSRWKRLRALSSSLTGSMGMREVTMSIIVPALSDGAQLWNEFAYTL